MATTTMKGRQSPMRRHPAIVRVTSYMGQRAVVANVQEPNGQVHPWILSIDLVPEEARAKSEFSYKQGDHVLYTEPVMPAAFKVPFYKLMAAKKRGKARRS